jgi:hypothetical protein
MPTQTLPGYDVYASTLRDYPMDKNDVVRVLPLSSWHATNDLILNTARHKPVKAGTETAVFINYRQADVDLDDYFNAPGQTRNPEIRPTIVEGHQPLVDSYFDTSWTEDELAKAGYSFSMDQGRPQFVENQAALIRFLHERQLRDYAEYLQALELSYYRIPVLTGAHKTPHGLPYFLRAITSAQAATATAKGAFQGANPVKRSEDGGGTGDNWLGIDTSLAKYKGLRNWNASWDADDSDADSVQLSEENLTRISVAFRNTNIPVPTTLQSQGLDPATWGGIKIFTDEYMINELGRVARSNNDSLGSDAIKFMLSETGTGTSIYGLPVYWTRELDANPTNADNIAAYGRHPMYIVNQNYMSMRYRTQKWMRERPVARDELHVPDKAVIYTDTTCNFCAVDSQRLGAVISMPAEA